MLIYLASPYSKFPGGRQQAYYLACKKAGELMLKGNNVFCPIAHSHPIEEYMGEIQKGDWWLKQDFEILKHCDELWVYQMPGWASSYGVAQEIKFAKWESIPVKYIPYETEEQQLNLFEDVQQSG
jgi:hypothetical protein